MNTVAIRTLSVNEAIADALRPYTAKLIARRLKTSPRTVEEWKHARTGPQAKHVAAMLQDAELAPALLTAMGRRDLATKAEIETLNQRIEALKTAEARHKEQAHEIRRGLEVGSPRGAVDRGQAEQRGGKAAPGGRVVP